MIVDFKHWSKLSSKIHKKGQKIVFVSGAFDLITPGHCRFLAEAKALGDVLVVGVCSDQSISKIKGPDFPLLNQSARMEMVGYLKLVDYVVSVDEGEPHTPIVLLQPDIFYLNIRDIKNGDFDEQAKYLLKAHHGKLVIREDENPYQNTNDIIEHIANTRFLEIVASYLWSKNISFDLNNASSFKPADYGQQLPNNEKAFNPGNRIFKNPLGLSELQKAMQEASGKKSKKVVFVSGTYDLLHIGHVRFIEKASTLGNTLVVGIPSDLKIASKKGFGRPIITEYSRAYVLASLSFVDYVYIFDEDTVLTTLDVLKPNVFFTVDEEWNAGLKKSPEYKTVKKYGGEIVISPRQSPFVSSSIMINRLAYRKVKSIFGDCMQEDKFSAMLMEKGRSDKKD